jgi:hypothetical protein
LLKFTHTSHLESNLCSNNFLKQESLLGDLLQEVTAAMTANSSNSNSNGQSSNECSIVKKLNELRRALLKNKQIRFYMCTDLNKLSESTKQLDKTWTELFPRSDAIFNSNEPFAVRPTWMLSKPKTSAANDVVAAVNGDRTQNHGAIAVAVAAAEPQQQQRTSSPVFTSSPKKDFIISLASTESSFLRCVASSCLNSYEHPDYAGVLVLIEYFCQTEVSVFSSNNNNYILK